MIFQRVPIKLGALTIHIHSKDKTPENYVKWHVHHTAQGYYLAQPILLTGKTYMTKDAYKYWQLDVVVPHVTNS
jgi:hypothetical protein